MRLPDGSPATAHTTNRVPFCLVDDTRKDKLLKPGTLADVAPTILSIMGLSRPAEMTGKVLL